MRYVFTGKIEIKMYAAQSLVIKTFDLVDIILLYNEFVRTHRKLLSSKCALVRIIICPSPGLHSDQEGFLCFQKSSQKATFINILQQPFACPSGVKGMKEVLVKIDISVFSDEYLVRFFFTRKMEIKCMLSRPCHKAL